VDPAWRAWRPVSTHVRNLTFDGKPLFPERRAYTVSYPLSVTEALLCKRVTEYVRDETSRADQLRRDGEGSRGAIVGFALTTLQRRLASSPEAIYQSLRRRRERLDVLLVSERTRLSRVCVAQPMRLWQQRHVVSGNVARHNYLPCGYANVGMHDPGLLTVALSDITPDAVLAAIAEYDRLGQEGFLERYGFDRARQYLVVHDGKRYDSKAIVGAAHGFLPGELPLGPGEFSGGEATVGRLLRRLGFTVQVGEVLTADRLVRLLSKLQVYGRDGLPALYPSAHQESQA